MDKSFSDFESELRISPQQVSAVLAISGVPLFLVSEIFCAPLEQLKLGQLVLLLYAVSMTVWLLGNWKPGLGRWFAIIALCTWIHLGNNWLGTSGFLTLLVIPTALAAVLISLPAAIVTVAGETMLLGLLPKYIAPGTGWATIAICLTSIWAILGMMCAMYHPVQQLNAWLKDYFKRAQSALEEALDRKVALEQALDDLAHANWQHELANKRLAALRLIAEEAQKTKAAFVAKVSHEFRTPLNMIIGLIDLLVETPEVYGEALPPTLIEDLKIVHRNCEHLSSMVNDVLALSQAEAGCLVLHKERVNLAEIIDSALTVVRPLLDKKNLGLKVIMPPDLPEIYCDRTRIRQVVLNLMSNAARFTDEGGITIHVVKEGSSVIVSVADTGPGILPKDAERIFEPFCQGTSKLWRDKSGSGLGLSISKQFVELHSGRIWLESEPGVGTTFSFELPISPPMGHVIRPGHWIREDWVWVERPSGPKMPRLPSKERVVICDETGVLYPSFSHNSDKVELIDTRNLAQATQELWRCPAHAVLLNATSLDTLWSLVERARLKIPDTPLIGCCVPPQTKEALKAGAVGYLIKPVKRADLEKAIQALDKPVRRVLAVDDDADVLRLWSRMLHACDGRLEVTTASSGEQALDELCQSPPDLVLLDIVMPDMDGWQVLELKGQDETIKDIPVLLITAQDPTGRPLASRVLLATVGDGLSLNKLLRGSLELSALLLKPD